MSNLENTRHKAGFDERVKTTKMLLQGKTSFEVAAQTGYSDTSVRSWRQEKKVLRQALTELGHDPKSVVVSAGVRGLRVLPPGTPVRKRRPRGTPTPAVSKKTISTPKAGDVFTRSLNEEKRRLQGRLAAIDLLLEEMGN